MSQLAYIIQRVPKTKHGFVELEKSTERLFLNHEDAEQYRVSDTILREFFRVYEVEVEFSQEQLLALKSELTDAH